MRLFIDENLHDQIVDILSAMAPHIQFSNAFRENLSGCDDVDLIPEIARRGFNTIVTDDRRQMVKPEEREALQDSGMHWVSVIKANVRGLHGLSAVTSTLVAALPHIIDIDAEVGSAQRMMLKGKGRERSQVLKHFPL